MTEAEKIELNKAVALKAELEAVAYGDLKKDFEERSIGEVFKAGTKKEVLITLALEALAKKGVVKGVENIVVEGAEVVEPQVKEDEQPIDNSHNVGKEREDEVYEEKEELVIEGEPKYTREVIEENLVILAATLKVCNETCRKTVFDKQEYLLAHLAYLDKWEAK